MIMHRPNDVQSLPDRITDFPFTIAVESWWPLVVLLLVLSTIALVWYLKRRAR
jgi:hypothetical protein